MGAPGGEDGLQVLFVEGLHELGAAGRDGGGELGVLSGFKRCVRNLEQFAGLLLGGRVYFVDHRFPFSPLPSSAFASAATAVITSGMPTRVQSFISTSPNRFDMRSLSKDAVSWPVRWR